MEQNGNIANRIHEAVAAARARASEMEGGYSQDNEESIRNQIREAVQLARERAYERAMEGGYMEDDMDGGALGFRKLENKHVLKKWPRGGVYKNKTKYHEKGDVYGQNLKPLNRRASEARYEDYETSPVLNNPSYRSYVVYVDVGGNFMLVQRKVDKLKTTKEGEKMVTIWQPRRFHGTPRAAARKATTAFLREESERFKNDYVVGRGSNGAELYEKVQGALRANLGDGAKPSGVRLLLVESTRGVRKRVNGKPVRRTPMNPLASFYTYDYWVSVEKSKSKPIQLKDAEGNAIVHKKGSKEGQQVVIAPKYKAIAMRNVKGSDNFESAMNTFLARSGKSKLKLTGDRLDVMRKAREMYSEQPAHVRKANVPKEFPREAYKAPKSEQDARKRALAQARNAKIAAYKSGNTIDDLD